MTQNRSGAAVAPVCIALAYLSFGLTQDIRKYVYVTFPTAVS